MGDRIDLSALKARRNGYPPPAAWIITILLVLTPMVANLTGFCWKRARWLSVAEKKEIILADALRLSIEVYNDSGVVPRSPDKFKAEPMTGRGGTESLRSFFPASTTDRIFSALWRGASSGIQVTSPDGRAAFYLIGPCGCIRDWTRTPD
ncbi:MAG TPA: hypothetical protein DCZ49_06080 [Hyphomonadaceae bacterium]|jgi:hypothetical protein|nr:hypothetical protein [Hyphomonadaceae bacterium]